MPSAKIDNGISARIQVSSFSKSDPSNDDKALLSLSKAAAQSNPVDIDELSSKQILKQYQHAATTATTQNIRHLSTFLESQFLHQQSEIDRQNKLLERLKTQSNLSAELRSATLISIGENSSDDTQKLANFSEALKLANSADMPVLKMLALNFMGLAKVEKGKFSQGIEHLRQALDIAEVTTHKRQQLLLLSNLAWACLEAGLTEKAIAYSTKLRLLADVYKDKTSELWALYDLGRIYSNLGERFEAETYLNLALTGVDSDQTDQSNERKLLQGFIYQELAETAWEYGALDEALSYAAKAKQAYLSIKDKENVANASYLQAIIRSEKGELGKAKALFSVTLDYEQKNSKEMYAALTQLRLSEVHAKQKEYNIASRYITDAMATLAKTQDKTRLGNAISQAGDLLLDMGHPTLALDTLLLAKEILQPTDIPKHQIQLFSRLAKVYTLLNNSDQAKRVIANAQALIDEQLRKARRHDIRRTYLALNRELYALHIDLLINTENNPKRALEIAESYNGRTLLEKVATSGLNQSADPKKVAERKEIHREIVAFSQRYDKTENADNSEVYNEVQLIVSKLELLEASISSESSLQVNTLPLSLESLLKLKSKTALYYFLSLSKSWLWIIEGEEISVYELPAEKEIEELTLGILEHVSLKPEERKTYDPWSNKNALKELSSILLKPLADKLRQRRDLLIIPDGVLHYLPFSLLYNPASQQPLIVSNNITVATSLRLHSLLEERKAIPVEEEAHALIVANSEFNSERGQLNNLPHALKEGLAIQDIIGKHNTTLLTGKSAEKNRFMHHLMKKPDILHFSTHAFASPKQPNLSGLHLSTGNDDEHMLLFPEISSLQNSGKMVVLSACETQFGRRIAGEGLFSLGRAFLGSGASQVIGGLWKVQDDATAELMKHFYKYVMVDKLTTAEALRQAKYSVYTNKEHDWRDPYYWAGFVLQGSGGSLFVGSENQ
jgi:CHAT domain-containing protein